MIKTCFIEQVPLGTPEKQHHKCFTVSKSKSFIIQMKNASVFSLFLAPSFSPIIWAQSFPSKPLKWVVPYTAGGVVGRHGKVGCSKNEPRSWPSRGHRE